MSEDPMQAAKDIDEVLDSRLPVVGINDEAGGEDLGVGNNIGSPVQCVAAVVDGTAALGSVVDSTQKLPLGCTHLGARGGAA